MRPLLKRQNGIRTFAVGAGVFLVTCLMLLYLKLTAGYKTLEDKEKAEAGKTHIIMSTSPAAVVAIMTAITPSPPKELKQAEEKLAKEKIIERSQVIDAPHPVGNGSLSTTALPYVEPKKPFNLSEDAVFRNGKSRLMKVFFDGAVVEPPGVILKLTGGGTGNQLFKYACSYALARDKNWTLYTFLDKDDYFKSRTFHPDQREFALDYFNIHLDNLIDSSSEIRGKTKTVSDKELLDGRMDILRGVNDSTFLELGYCQSREFWKLYQQEVKEMFSLTPHSNWGDPDIIRTNLYEIEKTESVAVHLRRGDSTSKRANLVPISYQRMAMEQMSEILGKRGKVPVFFVFSDDIQGATEGLKDLRSKYEILFISHKSGNSLLEFYLMMKCKHIIIPTSTFSWWAAFLNGNKDKVVIASKFNPEYFTHHWDKEEDREFPRKFFGSLYYPEEWIVLDPFKNGSNQLWN